MINNIYGNSNWLNVQTHPGNRPYINTTQPATGMLRYNANSYDGGMEVFDGNNWVPIANDSANIDLNEHTKEILVWAEKKMDEERKLEDLMKKHPGLKELNDKLEMMKVLCYEEEDKK